MKIYTLHGILMKWSELIEKSYKYKDFSEDELWSKVSDISVLWLKLFSQKIKEISTKKFDLILSGGDSGQLMVELTKKIYNKNKIKFPEKLVLPIYRTNPITNEKIESFSLDSYINKNLKKDLYKNILFVDDEIYKGNTLGASIEALFRASKINDDSRITIVAEDQGFNTEGYKRFKNILNFDPYAYELDGLSNVLSYLVYGNLKSKIREQFTEEVVNSRQLFNILLNLPNKDFKNNKATWSEKLHKSVGEKVDLPKLQKDFNEYLEKLIQ